MDNLGLFAFIGVFFFYVASAWLISQLGRAIGSWLADIRETSINRRYERERGRGKQFGAVDKKTGKLRVWRDGE